MKHNKYMLIVDSEPESFLRRLNQLAECDGAMTIIGYQVTYDRRHYALIQLKILKAKVMRLGRNAKAETN